MDLFSFCLVCVSSSTGSRFVKVVFKAIKFYPLGFPSSRLHLESRVVSMNQSPLSRPIVYTCSHTALGTPVVHVWSISSPPNTLVYQPLGDSCMLLALLHSLQDSNRRASLPRLSVIGGLSHLMFEQIYIVFGCQFWKINVK